MEQSAHDGSLRPIRDDISKLEYQLDKERKARKNLEALVLEMQNYLTNVMLWLDGEEKTRVWPETGKRERRKFHRQELRAIADE